MRLLQRSLSASPLRFGKPADFRADWAPSIVFVHGLTDGRESTWSAEGKKPWPSTLLPQSLPDVRVLTYGCDANVVSATEMVSKNRIGNHARILMTAITSFRENDGTAGYYLAVANASR